MEGISFDGLTSSEFEEFCFDLLQANGFVNLDWRKGKQSKEKQKHRWELTSMFLNAVGFVCLYFAFLATSSPMAVYTEGSRIALCFADHSLVWGDYSGRTVIGLSDDLSPCRKKTALKATAVVTSEHPYLGKAGFYLILASFRPMESYRFA